MISKHRITEIFCSVDDFYLVFDPALQKRQLTKGEKTINWRFKMSPNEIVTVTVLFHLSGFRTFKHFYISYVREHLKKEFPNTVSYNRFMELIQTNLLPLTLYINTCCLGKCTGISFINSTPIRACKNKRIKQHKVFKDIASIDKSTMGWFYSFKLHIVINDKVELLDFVITQANIDDSAPLKNKNFLKRIFGSLYADKEYISKERSTLLFDKGLHLVTGIRNNMKNVLMTMRDKILLRIRPVIEAINDQLNNIKTKRAA